MKESDLPDALWDMCDTIIHLDIDKSKISRDVYLFAISCRDKFMEQVKKKLDGCKTEEERQYVYDGSLNFLIFATRKLICDLDDEKIEYLAIEFNKRILSLKRNKED